MNIVELIVFVVVVIVLAALIFNNIRLFFKGRRLLKVLVQTTLDNIVLKEALEDLKQDHQLVVSTAESDGFVKFLSESREWAFDYIEGVQNSIKDLSLAMKSGEISKIDKSYLKLLEHLPKEGEPVE